MKKVGQLFRENLFGHIQEGIKKNNAIFLFSYTKISGSQANDFRKRIRQTGAKIFVSKNSIARKVLKDLNFDELSQKISAQTAFIWGNDDMVDISKALLKIAKECENINIQGGLLEGKLLQKEDIKKLADLPPREVLLSQLLGTIQAPVTRLMIVLNAKTRDLLSILKQLSEKR